jgi:glycine/D-amino acid oxidase-like deaminating enzyme
MPSMVASSIAKAAVGDSAVAEDRNGASLEHARLPAMAAVAITRQQNIDLFRTFKAVTPWRSALSWAGARPSTPSGIGVRGVHGILIYNRRRIGVRWIPR